MRHDIFSVNKDVYIYIVSIDNLPINWFWAWIMSMKTGSFKAHCPQKRSFCCSLAGEIFRRVGSCEGMVIW